MRSRSSLTSAILLKHSLKTSASLERRTVEMSNATLALKEAIRKGEISPNQFTKEELSQINKGLNKIDRFTWHHNSQSSPPNMQLIPTPIHDAVQHIGEGALSEGR
ncbi:HNH endonuclease [Pasteurella multocida]|uniref:HNH endonuclease n=1 Tax=Pasteurella multocida TaxID=747 RepID=UPI0032AEE587